MIPGSTSLHDCRISDYDGDYGGDHDYADNQITNLFFAH